MNKDEFKKAVQQYGDINYIYGKMSGFEESAQAYMPEIVKDCWDERKKVVGEDCNNMRNNIIAMFDSILDHKETQE